MKYYNTSLEDQETIINVLYQEQLIRIYSNRIEIIKSLTEKIGEPTKRIKRSKAYWGGASWDIDFSKVQTISKVLSKEIFIDEKFKYTTKKSKKSNSEKYTQISFDNIRPIGQ